MGISPGRNFLPLITPQLKLREPCHFAQNDVLPRRLHYNDRRNPSETAKASEEMHVHTPIKVRYGETDMMGVVYHANYLLYFEDARIDFLDALGFSYAERIEGAGYMSPIHDIEIHYKAPLRYGEAGVVRTSIAKNLPMRTVYRQQVYRAEDVLEGETADGIAGDPNAEGAAALGRREPQLREGATPLVDALVTVCVVERDTFKPVSLRHTFPDLYAKYEDIVEEA